MKLSAVNDATVASWVIGGKRNSSVPALRAMFNDAKSAKAGRLIDSNPFAHLGLNKSKGRRDEEPPTIGQMQVLLSHAKALTPPSFAAYLEFACLTGARPSELDALTWDHIRWDDGEVDLVQQYSAKARKFTVPKCGPYTQALVAPARDVLLSIPRAEGDSPFVFVTNRGTHYTPSSRNHHWNRVRCAAGMPHFDFYLATRHYFGAYALNQLELQPHVVADQLGHKDGGKLVTQLYGHPNKKRAWAKIRNAFDAANEGSNLHLVGANHA